MNDFRHSLKFSYLTMVLGIVVGFAWLVTAPAKADGYPRVMFVFDASGSMWGQAAGQTKIEAARDVMARVVPELPSEVRVGLTAYGHRRKGDCTDIEILIPPDSTDRDGLLAKVNALNPKGKTPIADSIKMVAEALKGMEDETTIVLISDGEETCHDDPCGVIKALKESGLKFILHVVGFGVTDAQKEKLLCLPEAGGGKYFTADDADGLFKALEEVKAEVTRKVEQAKTTTKKASTGLGKLQITVPESGLRCLNKITIVRKSDGKVLKTIESVKADSTHPLMAGEYEVIAGYANSNYKPDSEVSLGVFNIPGGEKVTLAMGALAVNIADSLKDIPAGAVICTRTDPAGVELRTPYTGNDYYFYKTKPLPPGTYDFGVHYRRGDLYRTADDPVVLVSGVVIEADAEATVTIDAGIQVAKPADATLTSWYLTKTGESDPVMTIKAASNGDYPLWRPYAVAPGVYDFYALIEGMTEPLPAGQGLNVAAGDLLNFDTGL